MNPSSSSSPQRNTLNLVPHTNIHATSYLLVASASAIPYNGSPKNTRSFRAINTQIHLAIFTSKQMRSVS